MAIIRDHEQSLKQITVPQPALVDFCLRNYIRFLAFFGSVLRDDFGPQSDIDVLADFIPGHVPGLGLIRMQDELSALFGGRPVDLVTLKFLHTRIRERVLAEMAVQYVQ